MAIDSRHPVFDIRLPDWEQLADCYKGERQIKDKDTKYLPPTTGMMLDGMSSGAPGRAAYDSYKMRAVFPNFVKEGIEAMVGVMHTEQARIELPPEMEPLREKFGPSGESIYMVLRRLNEYQLLYGRAGLLVDVPSGQGPDALPYALLYSGTRITNWDDGIIAQGKQRLEFVILNETDYERTGGFEWRSETRYRVCITRPALARLQSQDQLPDDSVGEYVTASMKSTDDSSLAGAEFVAPQIGGRSLQHIPFVFVNTKDLVSTPDEPPLLGLSNTCLAIYRGEADLRLNLHQQGQDTLVVIGGETEGADKDTRLGAGAKIELPRDGDAKFIGVSSQGLGAMREVIQADKQSAAELTSRLFENNGTTYQSGDALRIRISAKTATLKTIAMTSAEAIREVLTIMAEWMGADASKIKVEPNTDFSDTSTSSRTALELAQAKQIGFPLSERSLHRYAVQQGLTELSFEEETAEIDGEEPRIPQQGIGGAAAGGLGRSTGGSRVRRGVADGNTN